MYHIFSIIRERIISEQLFFTSFTNSPNMMGIIRRSDMVVLNANPMLLRTLGLDQEEIVNQPDDAMAIFADRTDRDNMILQFNKNGFVKDYEITLKTKTGKLIHTYHSIEAIQIRGEECMLSTIQDISLLKASENSLRAEKERFQRVLESFPFPLVISDIDENNIWANPKFSEVLGYTIEDIPDTKAWEKQAYPDKAYLEIVDAKLPDITTTLTKPRVNEVICKDGSVKSLIFQDIAIDDHEFISIFEDVTEKLQTEEHLKESQQRFRKIVEYFPYPIIATSHDDTFLYLNPAFSRTFGYTLEDLPNNEAWIEHAYPDPVYLAQIAAEVAKLQYSKANPRERHITCKDGKVKICVLQEIQIGSEEITIFQEITAQRSAEIQMLKKERQYRDIVENTRDLIFIVDKNAIIQSINPAVTDVLGYSEEDLIGSHAFDLILPEFHALTKSNMILKQERKAETALYEIDLRKKDGSILNTEIFSRIMSKGKEMIGILAICRDISIRKQISEERFRERKIESIGLLAGGIAHDFNNILVSIIGNINLLQMDMEDDNPSQEQQDILRDLEQGTLHARDLTKQLLTFSKGGAPVKKPESIEDVIRESSNFILRGSKSKCTFHLSPDLPPVDIDAGQINQVLNNLLINSSQAMAQGGIIHISASLEHVTINSLIPVLPGPYVLVTIKDSGPGIPKHLQSRIFDPYFTTKKAGTGLGLTMSYSIIKKHHGFITFSSKEGQGTTFYLYLPVATSEKVKEVTTPVFADHLGLSTGKVLILDDEKNIHTLLRRVFHRLGIEMESCYDGVEVLQKFKIAEQEGKPFDLIFMDLTIPGGMGGREAVQIIRNAYPDMKIIVSSGYSNDPVIANYLDYGFDDYLEKPFTINQLQALLQKWIKKS